MVDSVKLKQNLIKAYSQTHTIDEKTNISLFIRDSIYHPQRKLDSMYFYKNDVLNCQNSNKYLMLDSNFVADIILCKDSIVNIRVMWKTTKDFFPRMAMLAIKQDNDNFKVVGFVDIVRYKGACPCR